MPQGAIDLTKLSDEDLQIYEDLLKQRQNPAAAAPIPAAEPGMLDEPFVGPDSALYPVAEFARERLQGTKNAAEAIGGLIAHPLDNLVIPAAKTAYGIATRPADPNSYRPLIEPPARTAATVARNTGALMAPGSVEMATPERNKEAQGFAAQNAALLLAGEMAPKVLKAGADIVKNPPKIALESQSAADYFQNKANLNQARVLKPTTLAGKADVQRIAEPISRSGGVKGVRGSTIDTNILKKFDESGARVGAVEQRVLQDVRPEMQIDRDSLLGEIDKAKSKLSAPRTGVTARSDAINQLDTAREVIAKMPKFMDADQAIFLRRQFDDIAQESGGFNAAAPDKLRSSINRGVADLVRKEVNALDPELKAANREYSINRKAADVVKRRQLGETGEIGSGLPGRGGLLDDILAGWSGNLIGGPAGAVGAELVNLGRQTRGWANVKASASQQIADILRPKPMQPRALLGTGAPQVGIPANPPINVTTGRRYESSGMGMRQVPNAVDLLNARRLGLSIEEYMASKK